MLSYNIPYLDVKPVRLVEDWRGLTQLPTSNNSVCIMRINSNSNYTISNGVVTVSITN